MVRVVPSFRKSHRIVWVYYYQQESFIWQKMKLQKLSGFGGDGSLNKMFTVYAWEQSSDLQNLYTCLENMATSV